MNKNLLFTLFGIGCLCWSNRQATAQVADTFSQWSCMKGKTTDQEFSTTGAAGVFDATYRPGGRGGGATWVAADSSLWVFGGAGYSTGANGQLADMWRYKPSTNQWAYMSGTNNAANVAPVYGASGSFSAANQPGSRCNPLFWKDKNGKFWLYGGYRGSLVYADIWCFDPALNQWAYINGPQTTGSTPVSSGKGIAATTNNPGARNQGLCWTDASGNFWLFGGHSGSAGYNSLWKYIPSDNTWTWVSGELNAVNTAGVFGSGTGTVGHPGARWSACGWADPAGNFWIYGGVGRDATGSSDVHLADLWRFNPTAGEWTWMKGSSTGGTVAAVRGNKGVSNAANHPGSRNGYVVWKDFYGNAWIYSGTAPGGTYNDAWRHDAVTNEWTWMKGPGTFDQRPVIAGGVLASPDVANYPGGSGSHTMWTDLAGNLWLFGGWGWNGGGQYNLNTIWRLAPITPAQPNSFTTAPAMACQGAAGITYTVPAVGGATRYEWSYTASGATFSGGTSTATPTNNITFSGSATSGAIRVRATNGTGAGVYRDTAVTINTLPAVTLSPTGTRAICENDSLLLSATASGVSYQWKQGTNNVGANSASYYAKAAGSYTITATNTSTGCSATSSAAVITVNPLPALAVSPTTAQTICSGDSVRLTATSSGVTYQWKQGATNVGTNSATYQAKAAGSYTVTATSTTTNCFITSAPVAVTVNASPSVTVTPTGAQQICQGDTLRLNATASGVNYEWQLGTTPVGTGSGYAASTAGTYRVKVTSSTTNCVAFSNTTTLTVNSLPVATAQAGGPTSVCIGDSVVLTAGQGTGYAYQWKDGAASVGTGGASYIARTSGNYRAVVTVTATGCKDSTAVIPVIVHNRPATSLMPGDTAFCKGGVVNLFVETRDTGLEFRWRNGSAMIPLATANFLEINATGTYSVVVDRTGVRNCADTTNVVRVTVHELPVVSVTWDGLKLHATPGLSNYQWHIGGQPIAGAVDSTFQPASNNGYSVSVVDSNGCTGTSPVYNVTNVGVGEYGLLSDVRIYPNPAKDVVYIKSPVPVHVQVSAADGRVVLRQEHVSGRIDVAHLPSGLYLIRVTDVSGTARVTEKLFKTQ